jgi:hypothetical protein
MLHMCYVTSCITCYTAIVCAFVGAIKDRNKLARLLGFEDFYDYKVR